MMITICEEKMKFRWYWEYPIWKKDSFQEKNRQNH